MSDIPKIPDRPGNPSFVPGKPDLPGEPGKPDFNPIVPEPTPPISFPKPDPKPDPKDALVKKALVGHISEEVVPEPQRVPPDNPVLNQLGIDVETARNGRLIHDIPRYDDYWKVVERLRQYYNTIKNVNVSALLEEKLRSRLEPKTPVITELVPNKATLGDASFDLSVKGTGFDQGSVINFAGHDEPTTYVSPTEITTGVDMDVWKGPDTLPVIVLSREGVESNSMTFTFEAAPGRIVSVPEKAVSGIAHDLFSK